MSLNDCSKRMSILVNRFINNGTYTGLCVQLDEFIGQVIATYHELQRNDSIPSGVSTNDYDIGFIHVE